MNKKKPRKIGYKRKKYLMEGRLYYRTKEENKMLNNRIKRLKEAIILCKTKIKINQKFLDNIDREIKNENKTTTNAAVE